MWAVDFEKRFCRKIKTYEALRPSVIGGRTPLVPYPDLHEGFARDSDETYGFRQLRWLS